MSGKARSLLPIAGLLVALAAGTTGTWWASRPARPPQDGIEAVPRLAHIQPDYQGLVVPPNIAPLNFVIREDGQHFLVKLRGPAGEAIEVLSRSPVIQIPPRPWRRLLAANRGGDLQCDVYAEVDGQWRQYQPLVNHVAADAIDEYLMYRSIAPVHNQWHGMALVQRNLTNFEQRVVLDGQTLGDACINCHSVAGNAPQPMLIAIRSRVVGNAALLVDGDRVTKLGTPFGYTAWHPSGRLAAYSTNKVRQFFHAAGAQVRDVVDLESALAYFRVDACQSKRVPGAADAQQLATYPAWSPDGRYLYYCRAPLLWTDREASPPERYAEVRYDLLRIAYDLDADRWGVPEMILSSQETGLSILLPRLSPDGRCLLFCMCRYGCFPAFQPTSDLYLLDLEQGRHAKLAINSEFSESWHSWSSNSRWIAFSSKRGDGTFTRCYLSFVDQAGQAHKPFVVPLSDPEAYDSLLTTTSVPELLASPVSISAADLARAAQTQPTVAVDMPQDAAPQVDNTDPYPQAER